MAGAEVTDPRSPSGASGREVVSGERAGAGVARREGVWQRNRQRAIQSRARRGASASALPTTALHLFLPNCERVVRREEKGALDQGFLPTTTWCPLYRDASIDANKLTKCTIWSERKPNAFTRKDSESPGYLHADTDLLTRRPVAARHQYDIFTGYIRTLRSLLLTATLRARAPIHWGSMKAPASL